MQLRGGFPQAQLDVAELVARALELGCEALERRDRPLGKRDETCRALPFLGRQRLGGGRSGLGELRDVPEPLAIRAQLVLPARLHALGVLDECPELVETRFGESGVLRELLVAAARSQELAPRRPRLRAPLQLLVAAEPVEHLELVRRTREPPLLELPGHGDNTLDGCGNVLASGRSPPGVGTGASVAEDAPGHEQGVLIFGQKLHQLLELLREVELRLDIRLRAGGPDERVVPFRAQQQPDRLREDRLACAGLAGDRVQPGCELELRLANEHEVLDAQSAEHTFIVKRAPDGEEGAVWPRRALLRTRTSRGTG